VNPLFPQLPPYKMAKKISSPAKSTFNVKIHVITDMNIEVEATDENEAWEIATEMDRAKWNQETSEEEYDGVTQLTKLCSCGSTMKWDDLNEVWDCENCHTCVADYPMKTPWSAEVGMDGFSHVVNSDSVIIAQKCVKEEAKLFAISPMLLEECKIQLGNWQMLLDGSWDGSNPGILNAIERLQTVIRQAHGKKS
jgi:hypothetical protein